MDSAGLETTCSREVIEDPALPASLARIRVLIVASNFPPTGWGGAELAAEGVARWMAGHGHEVAVYTDAKDSMTQRPCSVSSPRRYAPRRYAWNHGANEHAKKGVLRKAVFHLLDHVPRWGRTNFAQAVEDFRPDLIMVHIAPGLGIGVFEYCAEYDLPVVYVMHDFWLTCLRSSMFSKSGASCERREILCQWSSKVRWGALSKIKRLGVWAPSRKVMELTKAQLGDVFPRVLIERNIVDFADFRNESDQSDDAVTRFLYVGKVTVAKGVAFILECLARLPKSVAFEIDIIGSGDAEEELRRLYAEDRRLHFHGLCSRPEVIRSYHRASVLLVPSIWFEPAGLVIYQAQVAGLPVIASDSGGIPELLSGRADSLIVPAGDHGKWISCLGSIAENRSLRNQMRVAAKMGASEYQANIDSGASRVVDFCRSVITSTHTNTCIRSQA